MEKYFGKRICYDKQEGYYCKICENYDLIGISELPSEVKMIRHIQTTHSERNLVVENTRRGYRLVALKIEQGKNEESSSKPIDPNSVFFPCEDCKAIFSSLEGKERHLQSKKKPLE